MGCLSQPVAGVGVTHRQREEAERDDHHQDVHHGKLSIGTGANPPSLLASLLQSRMAQIDIRQRRLRWCLGGIAGHKISRGRAPRRYRNLIVPRHGGGLTNGVTVSWRRHPGGHLAPLPRASRPRVLTPMNSRCCCGECGSHAGTGMAAQRATSETGNGLAGCAARIRLRRRPL